MSKQSLESFLESLVSSSEPSAEFTLDPRSALEKLSQFQLPEAGLWVVKMVQGAVAADLFGVEFAFSSSSIECRMYGAQVPSAKVLFEALVNSKAPSQRAQRHWVTALRSIYGQDFTRITWVSENHDQAEIVTIDKDQIKLTARPVQDLEVERFFLKIEYPSRWFPWSSVGVDEYKLLCDRCPFCPIPVTADSRLVSQQHPSRLTQGAVAALWMDGPRDGGPSFPLTIEEVPKGLTAPTLLVSKWASEDFGIHPCSLLVSLSPNGAKLEAPKVYWLRDGAVLGPLYLTTLLDGLSMTVICPGDQAETDLSEWALRDPSTAFPAAQVLECVRAIRDLLRPRVAKQKTSSSGSTLGTGAWITAETCLYLGWAGLIIGATIAVTSILVGAVSNSEAGVPQKFMNAIEEFCSAGPPTLESLPNQPPRS